MYKSQGHPLQYHCPSAHTDRLEISFFHRSIANLNQVTTKSVFVSNLLKRIVNCFKRAGYSLDIMLQIACLVFNPIMVEGYAALFSCMAVV